MDIEKFYDLLDGNLYFARADTFKDKFEGTIPKANFKAYVEWFYDPRYDSEDFKSKLVDIWTKLLLEKKKKVMISCWHISEHEDVGMWERYLENKKGVAVTSTVNQISLINYPSEYTFVEYPVKYIDFDKEEINDEVHFELIPFMYKRIQYISEKEYRFMLFKDKKEFKFEEQNEKLRKIDFNKPESVIENMYFSNSYNFDVKGLKVKINFEDIINEVFLSPELSESEVKDITEKIREKTNLDIKLKLKESELIRKPYNYSNIV